MPPYGKNIIWAVGILILGALLLRMYDTYELIWKHEDFLNRIRIQAQGPAQLQPQQPAPDRTDK